MKIGFIGLGQMGRGMASRIQAAGYDMVVTDLFPAAAAPFLEAGAAWADSATELGEQVDVVFTSLPTPSDVETVAEGLTAGLKPGTAWFDLSTNALDTVRALNERLSEHGIAFLDAPVSGGPAGAAGGRLAIWVGGDREVFDRHLDILLAMADKPAYIGEIGGGTIAKLMHNMASLAMSAVTTEMLTVGVKAGLEPLALYEAMRAGAAGRMRGFDNVSARFLQGKLDPASFQLRLAHKDAGLALRLARDVSVPTRLCDLVYDEITEAMNRGWQTRDSQTFLLLQQERSGVPPFALTAEEIEGVFDRT